MAHHYPSNNEFDVPVLAGLGNPHVQGPVMAWGSLSRGVRMTGTWAFYVDDYRFSALLSKPEQVANTGCAGAIEPNLTLHDTSPRAEVLWATYRKRACARTWQTLGIDVRVDLNVPHTHMADCLLGVPKGWRAFATRGYAARLRELQIEIELAAEWGGPLSTILVFGGGKPARALCERFPGAVYCVSHMDSVRASRGNVVPPAELADSPTVDAPIPAC